MDLVHKYQHSVHIGTLCFYEAKEQSLKQRKIKQFLIENEEIWNKSN